MASHMDPIAAPPAPASSSNGAFLAQRPGFGRSGVLTYVFANHFRVRFEPTTLFHYDVTIEPEPPRTLHRDIIQQAVKTYGKERLADALPAYDGQRALYTARKLDEQIEMDVELFEENDMGSRRRNRVFKVTLREASRPNLQHLSDFLAGRRRAVPQECLQALDIVLREAASKHFISRGRSFFGSHFGQEPLGGGIMAFKGFYQSIRPAQNNLLTLNIDIAAAPFVEPEMVPDFLAKAFQMDVRDLNKELAKPDAYGDSARVKAKKLLKGLRVETTHNRGATRKYKIQSISSQPLSDLTFDRNGETVSVVDYFLQTYNCRLFLRGLPAIESGTKEKKRYLPMEVCRIVVGQAYTKLLNEAQKAGILRATCVNTRDRKATTEKITGDLIRGTRNISEEFGVQVNRFLTEIPARVLPSPKISYGSNEVLPRQGVWNMRDKVMLKGCKVERWSLINFSPNLPDHSVESFCRKLSQDCDRYGLQMNPTTTVPWIFGRRYGSAEDAIKHLYQTCMQSTGKELQLIICIMPQTGNKAIYGAVKRFCEIELGLVTQCCLSDHIRACKPDYIANLLLKINVKLGGCNALLVDEINKRLPLISDVPSIIIGADVSHPRVGDDNSPSICSVAASMDWPFFSQYEAIVRSQSHREELLKELFWEKEDEQGRKQTGGMLKDLLRSFEQRSLQKPQRIIYYRDGVSEGEFEAVLNNELEAVKKACEALGWGSRLQNGGADAPQEKRLRPGESIPKITFIVVQKRHHTRFFPKDNGSALKNGNILPGTVVDSVICHPSQFDFFLCSHNGIKGTSRPAHYHVLRDENNFGVDEIQRLTNDLCFTYVRCTRAVSIVPPCYYAHLAAARARLWIASDGSDYGSQHDGASTVGSGGSRSSYSRTAAYSRPLPPLHDRIRSSMFFI